MQLDQKSKIHKCQSGAAILAKIHPNGVIGLFTRDQPESIRYVLALL